MEQFNDRTNKNNLFNKLFDLKGGYINVKKIKKSKKLNYTEIYNSNKLAFILNNLTEIKKTYRPEARDDLCLETYYTSSKFNNDSNLGFKLNKYTQKKNDLYTRMYGSISGQGMVRECRATIYNEYYNDIDCNNCHPVITKWICDNIGFECKYVSQYIDNRNPIFDELISLNPSYSRGMLKQLFLAIMYGGSNDFKKLPVKNDFIINYKNEISSIHKKFSEVFFNFYKIVEKLAIEKAEIENKEVYNIPGKNASQICGFVENQLLQYMISYIKDKLPEDKFNNTILCFDGLMFRSGFIDNVEMIRDLEKIFSDMDIPIKLSIKEFEPLNLESMGYDESIKYSFESKEKPKKEDISYDKNNINIFNGDFNLQNLVLCNTLFLDHDVADYFIEKYKNYIYFENKLFFYNGIAWIESVNSNEIIKTLSSEYFYINGEISNVMTEYKDDDSLLNILSTSKKNLKNLRKTSNLKSITEAIKSRITIDKDIFDNDPLLICFNNGTYDLKNDIFRENKQEDYIIKFNNYDFKFIKEDNDDMILLRSFLNKVMPINEELEFLLLILSTVLYGKTLNNFVICTGAGGNGKDTIFTYLMPKVICNNYYKGNVNSITKKSSSGVNQELANCHKRNMLIFNEPDANEKIITSSVKDITGGNEINARGIYCSNTNTKLTCSLFMLANDLPLLDKVDRAMERRLIVFNFNTLFKKEEEFLDFNLKEGRDENGNYNYLADPYFQSEDFIEKVKLSMMNLLIQYFKKFKDNKFILTKSPQSIRDNNKKYLSSSDNFISWFNSEYQLSDDKTDIIKLKDVYNLYKNSYLYDNLTKQDKRTNNYSWFYDHIKSNIYLRHYFKEHNTTKTIKRHLFNYKKIEIKDEDDDEDDEGNGDNYEFKFE